MGLAKSRSNSKSSESKCPEDASAASCGSKGSCHPTPSHNTNRSEVTRTSPWSNWFNHIRIHGTLGYLTPKEYKQRHLVKTV
ncbi:MULTISPECIES: IS3 family transposase [Exiguobacterium]|uniref:IS3 family transposase n=1 Tax=Exiguobacterium TaxID=33986 RepID=UPI003335DFE1